MDVVKEEKQIIFPILVLVAYSTNVNAELLNGLQDTFVVVGDPINFTCSSNISADIHWERNDDVVYAGGSIKAPFTQRFRMNKNETTATLTLLNATLEDAAEFMCQENQGTGKKSTASLTVLESYPQCQSNMKLDGFVGPNGCGIQQDAMTFTCAVSFNGKNPPTLTWTSADVSLPIEKSVCENKTNRINCSLTVIATKEFHGSSITCLMVASNETPYNCSIRDINVNYLFAPASNPAEVKVKDEISCLAESNQALRFTWTSSHDNEEKVVGNNRSHAVQSPGLYWCNVSYTIRGIERFSVGPIVYASEQCTCQPTWIPWLVSGLLLIFSIIVVFFYIRCRKMKETTRSLHNSPVELKPLQTTSLRERPSEEKPLLDKSETTKPAFLFGIETKASQEGTRPIYGLAILGDELFTISRLCKDFEVYEYRGDRAGELRRRCQVDGLKDPRNIVACEANECLYIENMKEGNKVNEIIRVNKENGKVLNRWKIDKDLGRISITKDSNVLVTVRSDSSLREYTPEGVLLREISFKKEDNINNLRHALLLDTGQYVLCHGDEKDAVKRVCIVDKSGKVLAKFGEETSDPKNETSDPEMKLTNPQYLATDPGGSILVVDGKRIVLLNRQLHFKGVLLEDDERMRCTFRVCLDIERIRLLVTDNEYNGLTNAKGRVFAYSVLCLNNQLTNRH